MKKALTQLHIAVLLAGFTGILGALIQLNEIGLVWYRIAITVGTLLLAALVLKQSVRITFTQGCKLMAIGSIIALHWVFFYGSIKLSNVSIGLICFASVGLFTSIFEPLINKTSFEPSEMLLGLMSLSGIYIIFHFDSRYQTGIIMGTLSSILAAIFSVLNKKMVSQTAPRLMQLYEMAGGLLVLSLLMPLYLHYFPAGNRIPTIMDIAWLLLLSWACTIWAMDLMLKSLQHISAFTQTLTLNLEPVYGIGMAWLFFKENEKLNNSFYLGFALIALSVAIQMYRVNRKSAAKSIH
ncbi:MAG: EamA family transporter [Chitinophagia bacterium]|nr:EamA family transporter [Chitinophagia bacterium]